MPTVRTQLAPMKPTANRSKRAKSVKIPKVLEPLPKPIPNRAVASINVDGYIGVAANSIEKLRRQDVYRVLEECPKAHRAEVAKYIARKRPDFADEVYECMIELSPEEAGIIGDIGNGIKTGIKKTYEAVKTGLHNTKEGIKSGVSRVGSTIKRLLAPSGSGGGGGHRSKGYTPKYRSKAPAKAKAPKAEVGEPPKEPPAPEEPGATPQTPPPSPEPTPTPPSPKPARAPRSPRPPKANPPPKPARAPRPPKAPKAPVEAIKPTPIPKQRAPRRKALAHMYAMEMAAEQWFVALTPKEQRAYLKSHPASRLGADDMYALKQNADVLSQKNSLLEEHHSGRANTWREKGNHPMAYRHEGAAKHYDMAASAFNNARVKYAQENVGAGHKHMDEGAKHAANAEKHVAANKLH